MTDDNAGPAPIAPPTEPVSSEPVSSELVAGAAACGQHGDGSDVQSSDVQDSDVQSSDLEDGDVRGSDVQDGDVQGSDIEGSDIEAKDVTEAGRRLILAQNTALDALRAREVTRAQLFAGAVSGGERKDLGEFLRWFHEPQGGSRPVVQAVLNRQEFSGAGQ